MKFPVNLLKAGQQILTRKPFIHYLLFSVTILTTYLAQDIWYSISIVTILLAHEMGHFLMCRKYKIQATLPYFIPIPPPLNPFGTMGAVIKMRGRIPNRKALFDVGVAGPLAGFFFTLISLFIGLLLQPSTGKPLLPLGTSLVYSGLLQWLNPQLLNNPNLIPHPLVFAGWVGLFITSLNLLPIGQLDGGHLIYSLFGPKSKYIYRFALVLFAINTAFYPPWIIFLILLITFGLGHPPPINDSTPLDGARKLIGAITFIIFIIAFMPFPFQIY